MIALKLPGDPRRFLAPLDALEVARAQELAALRLIRPPRLFPEGGRGHSGSGHKGSSLLGRRDWKPGHSSTFQRWGKHYSHQAGTGASTRLPIAAGAATMVRVTAWHSGLRTAALLILLTPGCSTREVNWDARRGKYTYEDAVQQYGPPARVESLPDGGKTGYWALADARTYAFKFQLPNFDGNNEGSLSPGKGAVPSGGRPLGTVGKPVLKLTFGADEQLKDAVRIKDAPPDPAADPAVQTAPTP